VKQSSKMASTESLTTSNPFAVLRAVLLLQTFASLRLCVRSFRRLGVRFFEPQLKDFA
jgi:hypothetical protein